MTLSAAPVDAVVSCAFSVFYAILENLLWRASQPWDDWYNERRTAAKKTSERLARVLRTKTGLRP